MCMLANALLQAIYPKHAKLCARSKLLLAMMIRFSSFGTFIHSAPSTSIWSSYPHQMSSQNSGRERTSLA
jgi:hypothetical protein